MTCFADGVVIAELSLTAVPVTVQAGTGHTTHLEHEQRHLGYGTYAGPPAMRTSTVTKRVR
jgi:hypothetical protein